MTRLQSGIFTAITSVKSPPLLNARACSCSSCAPSARWEGGARTLGSKTRALRQEAACIPALCQIWKALSLTQIDLPVTSSCNSNWRCSCAPFSILTRIDLPVTYAAEWYRPAHPLFQYPHTDRFACNIAALVIKAYAVIFQYPHTDRFACNSRVSSARHDGVRTFSILTRIDLPVTACPSRRAPVTSPLSVSSHGSICL